MAWVSYVIIALLFYMPVIGLGKMVQKDVMRLSVPLLPVSIPIPFSGALRLLLLSLGLWAVLWLVLYGLEMAGSLSLRRAGLRPGLLYARQPRLSISLAVFLSWATLVGALFLFIPALVKKILSLSLTGFLLRSPIDLLGACLPTLSPGGQPVLPPSVSPSFAPTPFALPQFVPSTSITGQQCGAALAQLLGRGLWETLSINPNSVITLSVFTLIVARFSQWEQQRRYWSDIRRNQLQRREKQKEIVIWGAE
jgi:hypothetical protein